NRTRDGQEGVPSRRRWRAVPGLDGSVRSAESRRRQRRRPRREAAGRPLMDVTDILRDRMQEPPGFQRMVTLSIAAHVVLAGVIILAPRGLMGHRESVREVMTISLSGGGAGPRTGGAPHNARGAGAR